MKVSIRPEAAKEVADAIQWYEAKCPGLGASFLSSVDDGIEQILEFPKSSPLAYRSVRKYVLKRFPYVVLYTNEPNEIILVAVFHAGRNPKDWMNRPSPGWEKTQ